MSGIFLVAAKRTPFGAFGGSLKALSATQLGVIASRAAIAQANIDPAIIDQVFFGNVIASSSDAAYLARHVALQSGTSIATPALTINRLCGSGFETVLQAVQQIQLGQANLVLAGGSENMSNAPLQVDGIKARWGVTLGSGGLHMKDALWDGLTDSHAGCPMGVTAENLANKYNISRKECDEFAIRSQTLWAKAQQEGVFDLEMAPCHVDTKHGTKVIDKDEHPKPDTSLEKISKLPAVFAKQGVVTAANASGICDGAGAILVASEAAVRQHNLTPIARFVCGAVVGCEPTEMGIGPVPAIQMALRKANMTLDQVDRVEINEAFAAQFLACAKELQLDMDKTNIHGGAISLGHPLGASGSRITAHLAHEFQRSQKSKVHVGAACIGGGQGIAIVLERA